MNFRPFYLKLKAFFGYHFHSKKLLYKS